MYNLKDKNGEVGFVMPAGTDFVASTMPIGKATGICNMGKVEESDKFPDYPICVNDGDYYFAGKFKAEVKDEKAAEPKKENQNFKKDKWHK